MTEMYFYASLNYILVYEGLKPNLFYISKLSLAVYI